MRDGVRPASPERNAPRFFRRLDQEARVAAKPVDTRTSFALLYFSSLAAGRPRGNALLRSLFDLTSAEARIAQGLAAGQDVDALVTRIGAQQISFI